MKLTMGKSRMFEGPETTGATLTDKAVRERLLWARQKIREAEEAGDKAAEECYHGYSQALAWVLWNGWGEMA